MSNEADTSLDIKNFDCGEWDFDAAGNYIITKKNEDLIKKFNLFD